MIEPEIPLVPPRNSRVRVRVGQTVRRTGNPWSPAVLDLLRHLEREGFAGAPRALGFDDQGREVLTYIEGEVGRGDSFIPSQGGRFDILLPDYVWRDEKCRAHGLPTGITDKARRFRLLLDAYGIEPDIGIVRAGIERMQELLEHLQKLAADGSAWEVELARRGVLEEGALEIAWVEEHAVGLVES